MPERHPFTESDDSHLVEFIAKNKPDPPGRYGNKLYKTLVENPKRWPWSKSHPWQSWRERYKQNAVWFDRKIRGYLKDQKAAFTRPGYASTKKTSDESESQTEESVEQEDQGTLNACTGEDDYMHQLFGSSIEDDDRDMAEPKDPRASSDPSPPSTERIYSVVTRSQGPTPLKIDLPTPSPVRHPVGPQSEKRQLKRKGPDDDPFMDDTPPPSPTPEQDPATRKAPPVLNEGPFRNLYAQTRNPGENRDVLVWPPNRNRKEKGPSRIADSHGPTSKPAIGRKIQQRVNAVASSSKVKLPPSTALRPEDAFLMGTAMQKSAQQPSPMLKSAVLPKTPITPAVEGIKTEQPSTKRQKTGSPPLTHLDLAFAPIPMSSPVNDSLLGNSSANDERPSRHIDLRKSLKKRRVCYGKSSLLSSCGSTASISNPISNHTNRRKSSASRHRQYVSHDEDLISLFERDLAGLGELYGFALGEVKKMYKQFETFEKTVQALRALNAIMRGGQDKLYEEMQRLNNEDCDTDDGDLIPEGVIPKKFSPRENGKQKEQGEGEIHDTPYNKRHRRSLNYKPLATDVVDQSEYSPPSRTCARRYTRLQKKGREEEALIAVSGRWTGDWLEDRFSTLKEAQVIRRQG